MNSSKHPRIIFLNQRAGPLFREMAEDISQEWSHRYKCGIVVNPGDIDGMGSEILALFSDKARLNRYRANSRRAAERFYSRKNTSRYLEVLSTISPLQQR